MDGRSYVIMFSVFPTKKIGHSTIKAWAEPNRKVLSGPKAHLKKDIYFVMFFLLLFFLHFETNA